MSNDVAVRLEHLLQHSLVPPTAAAAFGATVSFHFTSLCALDQVEDGTYVDLTCLAAPRRSTQHSS